MVALEGSLLLEVAVVAGPEVVAGQEDRHHIVAVVLVADRNGQAVADILEEALYRLVLVDCQDIQEEVAGLAAAVELRDILVEVFVLAASVSYQTESMAVAAHHFQIRFQLLPWLFPRSL